MAVFSSDLINRFSEEAEEAFATEYPCIIDRISLSIVSGVSVYTLPDYIVDVRKITWLGKRLNPISHRRYRDYFSPSSTGTPDTYIYTNVGQSKIKFTPAPNVTILQSLDGLWGPQIGNYVIVEYYRTPDFATFTIPAFFRRRLLKAYVLKRCFTIEGRGQNLKAAKYWDSKWNYLKEQYSQLLDELINAPRQIIVGKNETLINRLPKPQLPYNSIGIGVEPGE